MGIFPAFGQNTRSTHIDVNLIIDGSGAFSEIAEDATGWISQNLVDELLITGDRVTVWAAGEEAKIIHSGDIQSDADKESVKEALRGLSPEGDAADFSGALREAASRSSPSGISYTLLITSSAAALSKTLLGPQANLMRISRVEEFRGWRALVIGLNLESKVRQAASAFM